MLDSAQHLQGRLECREPFVQHFRQEAYPVALSMRFAWAVVLPGSMRVLSRMVMWRRLGVRYQCLAGPDAAREYNCAAVRAPSAPLVHLAFAPHVHQCNTDQGAACRVEGCTFEGQAMQDHNILSIRLRNGCSVYSSPSSRERMFARIGIHRYPADTGLSSCWLCKGEVGLILFEEHSEVVHIERTVPARRPSMCGPTARVHRIASVRLTSITNCNSASDRAVLALPGKATSGLRIEPPKLLMSTLMRPNSRRSCLRRAVPPQP